MWYWTVFKVYWCDCKGHGVVYTSYDGFEAKDDRSLPNDSVMMIPPTTWDVDRPYGL